MHRQDSARQDPATRRDFLTGRAAMAAIESCADVSGLEDPAHSFSPSDPSDSYLIHVGRRAMACWFEILFNAGQYTSDTELGLESLDLVDRLEDQMSVYRETSELSEINRLAGSGPVAVEAGLFELLQLCQRIFEDTDGSFDITTGPLSSVWGFLKRAGRVPSDQALAEALGRVGCQNLQLNPRDSTVNFLKSGMEINVNSIGKGYALDRCAEFLQASGVEHFLMHGGQSSVLARGSNVSVRKKGWTVGLRHPSRPDHRLAEFYLRDQALGTSGSGTQCFYWRGRRFGHLLDPRSGRPSQGVLSSTVIAPNAAEADALATAFYIMGPERARQYCRAHPPIAMLLVSPGDRAGDVELHSHGLQDEDWQLLEAPSGGNV